jgi:anti-sigma factor RsiW
VTHREIEEREIIDEYLRGHLSESDRDAFEEHFFACDDCFAQVQSAEQFAQGVRQAVRSGALPPAEEGHALLAAWLRPAFALCAAGVVILTAVTGWLALVDRPKWQHEAAAQRDQLEAERQHAATLEQQLATNRPPAAEANLPLVMLEASRAAVGNTVTIPAGAPQLALWIEIAPEAKSPAFRLEISTLANEPVERLEGLVRNTYGALAASVPAGKLKPGAYKVRLLGADASLVAEYRLEVRR